MGAACGLLPRLPGPGAMAENDGVKPSAEPGVPADPGPSAGEREWSERGSDRPSE